MKRRIAVITAVFAVLMLSALAESATWTGRFERVTLYDHTEGINCQYAINGDFFWRSFRGYSCPATTEVQ